MTFAFARMAERKEVEDGRMRKMTTLVACVVLVLLAGVAAARAGPAVAQDATPVASIPVAAHPVVGSWLLREPDEPDEPPSLVTFHADGTFLEVESDGTIGVGSWEATGERSVAVTFHEQF